MTDDDTGESTTASAPVPTPPLERSTGYGLTLALVGGVLLALAYYGVVSIQGAREIGQALPAPFYFLAIAFLFVLELLRSRDRIVLGVGRAIAFAAVYGSLFVLAVEGGAYVWANPSAALEGFVGVSVFAASIVVAALVYVGYLAVLESQSTDR